ncbi:uncharacterized protein LOC134667188 [Cydia fagiglandana]|uniref:uncharacterized protein LOC134667188 n=1 Tax=Cydia fagiglandana TaxID=1458189 RepID=UPI002FEE1FA8
MWLKIVLLVFGVTASSSLDVGGVLSGNRMGGVPLGVSLSEGELDVEGVCSKQGVACLNCSLAIKCVILPVGWLKVPLESCGEGMTCNAHLGGCSEQHVPECDSDTSEYQHSCEQIGMFPDAHDCRKFHICSPPEDSPTGRPADHRTALCPRHYGYNPATAQCSIPLKDGQCEKRPVPSCTKIGQTGVLPDSPNHYYVCRMKYNSLQPQIFLCPHGWYFVDGFCRPEPDVKCTTEATTVKATEVSRLESLFSTEKASTYKPDTFLADKFDLANYEVAEDEQRVTADSWENNVSW